MKNKNNFYIARVESWIELIFETFLPQVYFNVFDCTFISFLSSYHEINRGAIYWIIISLMIPA